MRRAYVTLLVGLLVVLSGCSGVFGGTSQSTETVTPVAVPTDEPTSTTVPELAPGLTRGGIENGTALVLAHRSTLQDRAFVATVRSVTVTGNESNPNRSVASGTLRAGPLGDGYRIRYGIDDERTLPNASGPAQYDAWANRTSYFANLTYPNGSSSYFERDTTGARTGYELAYGGLADTLASATTDETAVVGTVERNGTTLYRVRGETTEYGGQRIEFELLVGPRGLVREYTVERSTSSDSGVYDVTMGATLVSVGETTAPEPPSWLDEVPNQTTTPAA